MLESSISRRAMLARCALMLFPSIGRGETRPGAPLVQINALEAASHARIGLAAIDTGSGRTILHRESERFLFCSTWKFLVVAALLARVDKGEENLGRTVHFLKSDLVPYAPVTGRHLENGMTVAALCEAAITVSDNAAANLLLMAVGGFAGLNGFIRSLGDKMTALNRNEPAVNIPDGDEDTTTPQAMMGDMKTILLGNVLKPGSRKKLLDWLIANTTGGSMLRAGMPANWTVGDKTGHGDNAANDIAIVMPPGRKPILIAAYSMHHSGTTAPAPILGAIGKIVAATFAS